MDRFDGVLQHLPELRRYVRAMAGALELCDPLIEHALAELAADPESFDSTEPRVSLFRCFHRAVGYPAQATAARDGAPANAEERLFLQVASLEKEARAALILGHVLGFTIDETRRILGLSEVAVSEATCAARRQLARLALARVLIIEDDFLIAQEISHLVEALGQQVAGPAASYDEAIAIAADQRPTLVLADIQLRGGRMDGLRAGSELARQHGAPLIVITAYPERLAQAFDVRPERMFTKPFDYQALRGAIANPPSAATA